MQQTPSNSAFRKINKFHPLYFILTISQTFHLVHPSTFQQLPGSTGSESSSADTKAAVHTAVF